MRTPDWQSPDGLIQLHNCRCEDFLEEMPPRSVDCIVTSPPYNTLEGETKAYGFRAKRQSGVDGFLEKRQRCGYSDKMPERRYQAWLNWIVEWLIEVSKGPVWLNHKTRYRDDRAVIPTRFITADVWNEVIWRRRGSMAQNCRKFKPSTESLFAFGSRGYWSPDAGDQLLNDWDDIAPERGFEEHVCPWPPEIPLRLIRATCPPGGTVLDVFAGRATAAVAAIRIGYGIKCICVERDGRAFEASVRYIEAEYQRTSLLDAAKMSQKDLLEGVA